MTKRGASEIDEPFSLVFPSFGSGDFHIDPTTASTAIRASAGRYSPRLDLTLCEPQQNPVLEILKDHQAIETIDCPNLHVQDHSEVSHILTRLRPHALAVQSNWRLSPNANRLCSGLLSQI